MMNVDKRQFYLDCVRDYLLSGNCNLCFVDESSSDSIALYISCKVWDIPLPEVLPEVVLLHQKELDEFIGQNKDNFIRTVLSALFGYYYGDE